VILQLLVATIMVIITVIIHGAGLAFLGRVLLSEAAEERAHHVPALSRRTLFFTVGLVIALFALHGVEI
jgi:hypothetical protein